MPNLEIFHIFPNFLSHLATGEATRIQCFLYYISTTMLPVTNQIYTKISIILCPRL